MSKSAATGGGGDMSPLEMESLVTGGGGGVKARRGGASGGRSADDPSLFSALMIRNSNFSARNLFLLFGLGGLTFVFVKTVGGTTESIRPEGGTPPPPVGGHHGSSLGGVNNLGQPAVAKAFLNGEFGYEDIFVPVSNVGHAVKSLSPENVANLMGHYVHDEHYSPYASHLYAKNRTELDEEQRKFTEKMDKVREEWGAWDFRDDYKERQGEDRPLADFSSAPYRDLPASDFPPGSWQSDPEYVSNFLREAKALVVRVREGIYAEYGHPTKNADGAELTPEERTKRDGRFRVARGEGENPRGAIGSFSPRAWAGLVRKLLHAMITNDEFYAVLGGHSAAAGHGNDFRQAKMMVFHYVMEPVFDRLGMRLVSRNMAQGGVGTTHSAFASGSIYGEKDLLFWDSGMTEKAHGALDVFNKQAILGGERVPVIVDCPPVNIMEDTNGTAWIGKTGPFDVSEYVTTDDAQAETLPFAVRYMSCPKENQDLCRQHKYDAVCWEPRSDFAPQTPQAAHPGSQVGWHPGNRVHQLSGRVYSLVVLTALEDAIDTWRDVTKAGGEGEGEGEGAAPLPPDEHWHVGGEYRKIQDALRTHMSTSAEGSSACEQLFTMYPRVCRVQMHGFGLWTPRVNPDYSSLLTLVRPAADGYKPSLTAEEEYEGIDVMPYDQRVPYGQVDVHAIAIATTSPPPPGLNNTWENEEDRRRLVEATRAAARHRLDRVRRLHGRGRALAGVDEEEAAKSQKGDAQSMRQRSLFNYSYSDGVEPGRGWTWINQKTGFCDGSYASSCGRVKGSNCLILGHNDGRSTILGDALSGWLVLTVPRVREGIILLRIEWWVSANIVERTKDWRDVNGGGDSGANASSRGLAGDDYGRRLPAKNVGQMPEDLQFDIAINGNITKTMNKEKFVSFGKEIVKNFALWPIMDNVEWAKRDWSDRDGEDVEVGIRLRSDTGRACTISVSHVYYA